MSSIKVLIVEDEVLIAEDMKSILTNIDYSVETIAHTLEDGLKALRTCDIDIALLDINLGGNMDGIKIAEEINKNYQFPFLFVTSYSSKMVVDQAKHTRPMGYIVKPFDEGDLFTSIEIALYNFSQLHKPAQFNRDLVNGAFSCELTEKEFEILEDIYEGNTNKQMSANHFVSVNTIKTHVQNIYDKLDVHSRSMTITKLRSLL